MVTHGQERKQSLETEPETAQTLGSQNYKTEYVISIYWVWNKYEKYAKGLKIVKIV